MDRPDAAFSLLGFALNGTPLATTRVQDGRRGPLELRRFIDPKVILGAAERPSAQFGQLSVLRSVKKTHVMLVSSSALGTGAFKKG